MTKIVYFTSLSGNNPIDRFLNSLSSKQQVKILRIFQSIREYGLSSVLPHIKKLTRTPLWEIRILGKDNIRVLYAVPYLNTVIVLHGFIKKTQKTPQEEIETALKRFIEYQRLDK